jgi:hypothetical protein
VTRNKRYTPSHPFQITCHFGYSRYIHFVMYVDIHIYLGIHQKGAYQVETKPHLSKLCKLRSGALDLYLKAADRGGSILQTAARRPPNPSCVLQLHPYPPIPQAPLGTIASSSRKNAGKRNGDIEVVGAEAAVGARRSSLLPVQCAGSTNLRPPSSRRPAGPPPPKAL